MDDEAALSMEDVRALRTAEDMAFYHSDGRSFIRAWLRDTSDIADGPVRVFTPTQQRLFCDAGSNGSRDRSRTIPCGAEVSGYDRKGRSWWPRDLSEVTCYQYGKPSWHGVWQTVTDLLRAGDRLTLKWLGGNNNQYVNDADLYVDELYLVVLRGDRRMVFSLGHSVSPDNTGRMITRHGYTMA